MYSPLSLDGFSTVGGFLREEVPGPHQPKDTASRSDTSGLFESRAGCYVRGRTAGRAPDAGRSSP